MTLQSLGILVAAVLGLLLFTALVIARLYRRATREVSLVKTGAGGKRVIIDGGTIAIPLLHEVSPVNMKTLRLEVRRQADGAMITKDRMRVDVGVEFYVSVQATAEGIARAAQTLGNRTFHVDQLREMIEGKLIDGLRAVAARMTMDELHENRSNFVQEVQNAVSNDLLKNGLELESVSLTALDQTPFEALDENNAFNAVGMRKLAEVIAKSKKERAQIDADAEVSVRRSAMEAEKLKLQIAQEEEEERIARTRDVELKRAAQEAEIALSREVSASEQERARIRREEEIRAAEIARERALAAAQITKEREIEAAQITKEREIEVANQERRIVVAQKSEEESRARASADAARAEATRAAEAIETARAVAEAERQKQIALIEATREAEREATRLRLAAEAERAAAEDRAAARREEAQGEADSVTILAAAKKADLLAEAEGRQALVQSENALSESIVAMRIALAKVEALPKVVEQMVKPAEKIDSIRIHQIGGLASAASGPSGAAASPVNQAFDAMLGAAMQLPVMRKLGEDLGMSFDAGMDGLLAAGPDEKADRRAPEAGADANR